MLLKTTHFLHIIHRISKNMVKRKLILLFCSYLFLQNVLATDLYKAASIPDTLKERADAVIRLHQAAFNIQAIDAATYHEKYVITILNKAGQQFGPIYLGYDKQRKVKDIIGNIYDAKGNLIKKLKSKDFEDFSAFTGSLYQENRVKHFEHVPTVYPYTIEYEYEILYDGLLQYPKWQPQPDPTVAVEKSGFTVSLPVDLEFRYKERNIREAAKYIVSGNIKSYQWEISNVYAIKDELFSPHFTELTPIVYTAPNNFRFEGYAGNMESWENFGAWINTLNQGRDQLPAPTLDEVNNLVKDIPGTKEKVRKLYEYLQSKTRYVSIQLGIGGYQPFEAAVVDRVGYGDCKALTNYMQTLLKGVGIPSYYTLVKAGPHALPIQSDFPSTQFNHVILCVPVEKDTIWLECTNQEIPFGYLGNFTSDREVLLVKEDRAEIVRTPAYQQEQNTQMRKAEVVLDENGNGTVQVETVYAGLQYENVRSILRERHEEQKKAIYQKTDIPTFDLNQFSYAVQKSSIPSATEKLNITLRNYANVSGKRLFFCPNLMNKSSLMPPKNEERKNDIVRRTPYVDIDTVLYKLPESLHPEYMPEVIEIHSPFGSYEASFQAEQGGLLYVRKITINKGIFPASQYEELINFYQEINKADHTKVVLRKST